MTTTLPPPLGDIFRNHGICLNIYVYDTQAYLEYSPEEEEHVQSKIESYLNEVKTWMVVNRLKLSD